MATSNDTQIVSSVPQVTVLGPPPLIMILSDRPSDTHGATITGDADYINVSQVMQNPEDAMHNQRVL